MSLGPSPAATTMLSWSSTRSSAGITQVRFSGSAALLPPSQPGCPELPVSLEPILARDNPLVRELVDTIAAASIGATFNQYRDGTRAPLLRARLTAYLEDHARAELLLVGEAPGYRGARVSGIPFTSERQLTGSGPAEATATVMHRVLAELGLEPGVLLWNVVPTHPGTEVSNRVPTPAEIEAGIVFARLLAKGRRIVAIGRVAERVLGGPYVRHPSHGGAAAFRAGLADVATNRR
jgi:uracil-DNA glycosylase